MLNLELQDTILKKVRKGIFFFANPNYFLDMQSLVFSRRRNVRRNLDQKVQGAPTSFRQEISKPHER